MKKVFAFIFIMTASVFSNPGMAQSAEFHHRAERPPMGWNSYNCFGAAVHESEIKGNAEIMAVHLKRVEWQYIVIDYCWYYPHVYPANARGFKTSAGISSRTWCAPPLLYRQRLNITKVMENLGKVKYAENNEGSSQ